MPWSLNSRMPPQDPGLVDAAMLATGKALYLANAFESKCKYILQFLKLTDFLDKNPGCAHPDALAHIAQTKMLGATLKEMTAFTAEVTAANAAALDKAREGRNFIAHESALGSICEILSVAVAEHLPRLRTAVRNLAAGDGIVSA